MLRHLSLLQKCSIHVVFTLCAVCSVRPLSPRICTRMYLSSSTVPFLYIRFTEEKPEGILYIREGVPDSRYPDNEKLFWEERVLSRILMTWDGLSLESLPCALRVGRFSRREKQI